MNNDLLQISAQVDPAILRNLHEVKETIASPAALKKAGIRTFGLHDLWNIRRKSVSAAARLRR